MANIEETERRADVAQVLVAKDTGPSEDAKVYAKGQQNESLDSAAQAENDVVKDSKTQGSDSSSGQSITIPYPTVRNGSAGNRIMRRNRSGAPLLKLTVDLIKTYKQINKVYYEKKKAKQELHRKGGKKPDGAEADKNDRSAGATTTSANSGVLYNGGHDDENYDYKIIPDEVLNNRYMVKQRIGKGSFGQVVRAIDQTTKEEVAVKIIKSKKPFFRQAKTEIELLRELNTKDPRDQFFIVRLKDTFVHHNHQCLVFEMLSYNLYDLLRNTQFLGISLTLLRKFARQILKSLYFLAQPDVNIIHCDLKPENILLRNSKRSAIKIIDFGSSCKSNKRLYSYIQSRFYRSPEVMLGRQYTVAIDMWSLGCILVEMHTGEPLFSGTDEYDQMLRLVSILGLPSNRYLESSPKVYHFFEQARQEDGSVVWKMKARRRGSNVDAAVAQHSKTLHQILGLEGKGPAERRKREAGHTREHYNYFADFISRMLAYDPLERITPLDALNHPFLKSDSVRSSKTTAQSREGSQQGLQGRDRAKFSNYSAESSRKMVRRPGSAPAAAKFGTATLNRTSRVAKQGFKG